MAPPRAEEGAAFASSTRSAALRLFASRLGFAVRQAKGQLFGGDRTRFVEPLQDVLDDIGAALVFGGVSVQSAPTALGYQLPLLQALASRLEVATALPTSPVAPSSLAGSSSGAASSSAAHEMQESLASLSSKVDMVLRSLAVGAAARAPAEVAAGRSRGCFRTGTGKGGGSSGGCSSRRGSEGGGRIRAGSCRGTGGGGCEVAAAEAPEKEEAAADEAAAKAADGAVCEVGVVAGRMGSGGIVGGMEADEDDKKMEEQVLIGEQAVADEATAEAPFEEAATEAAVAEEAAAEEAAAEVKSGEGFKKLEEQLGEQAAAEEATADAEFEFKNKCPQGSVFGALPGTYVLTLAPLEEAAAEAAAEEAAAVEAATEEPSEAVSEEATAEAPKEEAAAGEAVAVAPAEAASVEATAEVTSETDEDDKAMKQLEPWTVNEWRVARARWEDFKAACEAAEAAEAEEEDKEARSRALRLGVVEGRRVARARRAKQAAVAAAEKKRPSPGLS